MFPTEKQTFCKNYVIDQRYKKNNLQEINDEVLCILIYVNLFTLTSDLHNKIFYSSHCEVSMIILAYRFLVSFFKFGLDSMGSVEIVIVKSTCARYLARRVRHESMALIHKNLASPLIAGVGIDHVWM